MNIRSFFYSDNSRSKILKKNIIASFLIKGVSIVVQLMLVPMTLGYVNSEMYGIWLTLSSIMLWLNFFDIGFTLGLKNRLAEAIAVQEWDKGRALVSTTYVLMLLIFVPLFFVLEFAVPHIDWASFLNVPSFYNHEIISTLYILVACFCIQMIVNVISSVIAAYQKVALSSSLPVIGNIFSLLIIFLLTKYVPPRLYNLALAISVMPIIVMAVVSAILYRTSFRKVAPSYKLFRRKYVRDLFSLGVKFFIIQVQAVVLYQTTNILISNLSGPNDVTAYNVAYKYLSVGIMFFSIILLPIWPAFTDAYAKNDFAWMRNIYMKMCKLYVLTFGSLVAMVLGSSFVYQLWIGQMVSIPFIMTLLVGVYVIIHSWDSIQIAMINGIGKVKLQMYITVIGLVTHIPLSIFLGRYIGCYGVLVSMIAINSLYSICFTIQINKLMRGKAMGIWNQ